MESKLARTIDDAPSEHEAVAPDRFIRISAGKIIAALVDAVMRGEAYVALTGPAGSGKTTAAAAIRDELVGRSVQVRSVCRGQADRLRLRDIAAQLLGHPKETLTDVIASFDEIAGLFKVMAAESRSVLIIDDAEVLQPSALEYLCEMASMTMPARPQFVFVGRPEFWEVTNRTAPAQFKDQITARWELGRLSADTTCAFIERLVASQGQSMRDVFDTGGLAALMEKSDGLFGRIVALLTRARAIQAAQRVPRLTSGVIEAAAALDGGQTTALDYGGASANSATVHTAAAESDPVPGAALALAPARPALSDPAGESFGGAGTVADWGIPTGSYRTATPVSPNRPLSLHRRSYAYALGLVLVLSAAGTVAYWGIPAGPNRTATPATELDAPTNVASPAQSAASGAAARSQQGTTPAQADIEAAVTNEPLLSLSEDAPAAAAAQPDSGQPTANAANRSAAVVPQAGAGIADNAPEQPAPHGTAPDVTVAAAAMPAAQRAAQAGIPPAAPLAAVPTQGPVAAESAATPVEPPSPQAAMPPAAPLPAVPTQGQVAASTTTPTEPPSPQAAMPPAAPLPAVPTQGQVSASTATPTEPSSPQAAMPPAAPLPAVPTQGPVAASTATPTEPPSPQAAMPPAAPLPAVPTQGPVAASTATPTEPPSPQAAMAPAAPLPAVPTQGPAAASTATPTDPPSPQAAIPPAAPLPAVPTQGPAAASTATPTDPPSPQAATPPSAPSPAVPTQGPESASPATPAEPPSPQAAIPPAAPLPAVPTR